MHWVLYTFFCFREGTMLMFNFETTNRTEIISGKNRILSHLFLSSYNHYVITINSPPKEQRYLSYLQKEKMTAGNSLVAQWLGLGDFVCWTLGSTPGQGTKIMQAMWHDQKNLKPKKRGRGSKAIIIYDKNIHWAEVENMTPKSVKLGKCLLVATQKRLINH